MTTIEQWRGVAAEGVDDLPGRVSVLLRRRTRRLLGSLLRPHRRAVGLMGVTILVGNLAAMAGPYLVGLAIDRGIPDVRHGDDTTLVVIVALIVASAGLQAVLYRTFLVGAGRIGQDLLFDLRQRVFAHFQRLSLAFHERYTSGRMISRLTSDLDSINDLLDAGLDTLVTAALSIVSVGIILLVLDLPLGLVALGAFLPLLALSRWYQRRSTVAYRRTREAIALVIVHFTESLRGIRAVHAFRREPRNDEIFERLNDGYRTAMSRSFRLLTFYWPGIRLIGNVTTAAILLYGGFRVIGGSTKVGVLASFLLYLRRFFEPMADVSQFYDSFQGAAAGLEKLAGVLDEEPSVAMPRRSTAAPADGWLGRVEFRDVHFAYRAGPEVLSGFDLDVPAGQTVALLGRTGAGKSTVARLLARLYDPTRGEVRVDGVPLTALCEADLRRGVAMVTQESFLFSGSAADNIGFGRADATRAEIEAAARAIGAHDFLSALPLGLDSDVGKNGSNLSAGQRQLIALARAFLADPAVLILDEASSSLDAPTERAVQHALRTLLAGRTAVIIAHRLSTVDIADRVLVLERGSVVEDGRPEALLAVQDGEYAALHRAWRDSLI
ncbi:MAG TPA: ABC transporter ATP-binding protein [Mycobacteriales bacterium]|nr:ABC transporter ATP-binding protein [Mycobacteriales bacterium]